MDPVRVTHSIRLPDELRLARARRAPEVGPRILFFSGGTAMRGLSRKLKRYTHNSTHLITPFDSGGSSAKLRDAFDMLSIGDIRNRLVALADETVRGNAVLALGHIARIHGALDRAKADAILRRAKGDDSAYVRGQAEAAGDDIAHFLG